MDKIAKDVGDIQSRLLHHRPVINAEIRYFVAEFEVSIYCVNDLIFASSKNGWTINGNIIRFMEKRGHRESRLLENLNKMVAETNEQALPTNSEGENEGVMSDIIKRLEAANHMAERVQQRELEAQQSTQLQTNMEHLKEQWADFLKEQQRLKEEVDEEHNKAVGRISTHYSEMKIDLMKSPPF